MPKVFKYPLLSQERVKLRTSNLAGTITGSIRTKAHWKVLRKGNVGVSRHCSKFLSTPIISGTGKATNFKFCTHINTIDCNKFLLTISWQVAVGVARDSQKCSGQLYNKHRAVIFAIARLSCYVGGIMYSVHGARHLMNLEAAEREIAVTTVVPNTSSKCSTYHVVPDKRTDRQAEMP